MPMNAPATTTSTPTPPKRDDPAQPVVTNGDAIDPEGLSLVTKAQMEWHERDAKQRHGLTLAPKPVKRTDAGDDEALDEVTKAQRDWHARVYPGPGDAA